MSAATHVRTSARLILNVWVRGKSSSGQSRQPAMRWFGPRVPLAALTAASSRSWATAGSLPPTTPGSPADEQPTREDLAYATLLAYLRRNAAIALVAPFLPVSLFPVGSIGVLLVLLISLGEAFFYLGLQRRRGVRPADPVTSLGTIARWIRRLIIAAVVAIGILVLNALFERIGQEGR